MFYERHLNLQSLLEKKSLLLIGPRQTGKTTLLRSLDPTAMYVDLNEANTFRELSAFPERLRQRLLPSTTLVVIDEAQKIPELFDEVQSMLDRNKALRFVLCGSSARKLRRNSVNLLPGRIWRREIFPLVSPELGATRLQDRVQRGALPGIIDSADFRQELHNYASLYLEEEIRSEGLTRNIGAFARFLPVAARCNTEQINFTEISSDTGIKLNTVRGYFEILSDTLIGRTVLPFQKAKSRKAVATPKFYFFDQGVVNGILNEFDISPSGERFGKALEQLVFQELDAFLSYNQRPEVLSFWRTHSQFEVDFILGDSVAIEVKAKSMIGVRDERGLNALAEDVKLKRRIIVSPEAHYRITDSGNEIMPLDSFLTELWSGGIL